MVKRIAQGLVLACGLACAGAAGAAEVIVNMPGEPGVSRPFLRGMFGMRVRAWPNGTPVRVFVLPDTDPAHVAFSTQVLQMYPYQLRQNWDRLVYSGTGQPPIEVDSEPELLRRVAETPGSIGYISKSAGDLPGQVRVLDVR